MHWRLRGTVAVAVAFVDAIGARGEAWAVRVWQRRVLTMMMLVLMLMMRK